MNLTAVLEIIISLAALYWLLSMACSYGVEAINSMLLNVRAKALERFVCEMVLGTGKVPQLLAWRRWSFFIRSALDATKKGGKAASNSDAGSLADPLGLFSHGLVKSLRKPRYLSTGRAAPPSYIPSHVFAQALLDRLKMLSWCADPVAGGDMAPLLALLRSPGNVSVPSAVDALGKLVVGSSSLLDLAAALLRSLNTMTVKDGYQILGTWIQLLDKLPTPATEPVQHLRSIFQAARDALQELPERNQKDPRPLCEVVGTDALWLLAVRIAGREVVVNTVVLDAVQKLLVAAPLPSALKESLRPLLADPHVGVETLVKGIERWYEDVMDRASGWFKRNVTGMLGLLGLAAAVSMNVNTLNVVQDLAHDPNLRLAGVAAAENIYLAGGRPVMAQQVALLDLDKQGQWLKTAQAAQQAVSAAASAPATTASAAIAQQIGVVRGAVVDWQSLRDTLRARLLTSGQYMAAMLLAQHQTGTRFAAQDAKAAMDEVDRASLRKALCTAAIADAAAPASAASGTPPPVCELGTKLLPAKAAARVAELGKVWTSDAVVWHTGLSKALFELDEQAAAFEAAASAEAQAKQFAPLALAWAEVVAQYGEAVKVARNDAGQAEAFLGRIPSLQKKVVWSEVGWRDAVGWLITAFMVSFGAPFWFDLISKLLGQRSATGPKPAPAVL
ncbi:hypothetical protein os1_17910 [Comamonadaceae bacterium OS-1]|nr:hypothetical protein os1_17910 [Comamonadaceae bacterium OS-1]